MLSRPKVDKPVISFLNIMDSDSFLLAPGLAEGLFSGEGSFLRCLGGACFGPCITVSFCVL